MLFNRMRQQRRCLLRARRRRRSKGRAKKIRTRRSRSPMFLTQVLILTRLYLYSKHRIKKQRITQKARMRRKRKLNSQFNCLRRPLWAGILTTIWRTLKRSRRKSWRTWRKKQRKRARKCTQLSSCWGWGLITRRDPWIWRFWISRTRKENTSSGSSPCRKSISSRKT